MSRKIRSLVVALVLAAFTSGSVGALPFEALGGAERESLLSIAWEWLASFLEPGSPTPGDPVSSLDKEGPQLDPDGED
jgi:hypothetical protein